MSVRDVVDFFLAVVQPLHLLFLSPEHIVSWMISE
jgi:hypothetical protein